MHPNFRWKYADLCLHSVLEKPFTTLLMLIFMVNFEIGEWISFSECILILKTET
jgi:hypothetical protein